MSLPEVVSPETWLTARSELLEREKQLTVLRDQLNADRRRLPMVRVEKDYVFDGPDGPVSLLQLFDGAGQLIVKHFMFDPDWSDGCPGCTADTDEFSEGIRTHLRSRDTAYAVISRAPLAKLEDYRARRGWDLRWYSSFGSEFNYDFHATLDSSVAPVLVNYRRPAQLAAMGMSWDDSEHQEMPGYSCFLREGDQIFHTYSTFARGTEYLGNAYTLLDLTARGRAEEWEEPKGRVPDPHPADPSFSS